MKYYYYQIRNIQNDKRYIGITTNAAERIGRHKTELKYNKHHSIRLQNSYNKYGENNFEFKIIETKIFNNSKEAYQYELELIKKFDSKENGFNMTDEISPMANPEIAAKVKKTNQEKVDNVLQIDMETWTVIETYPSIHEASRITSIPRNNISVVCNRGDISAGGYYWSFEKDYSEKWIPKLNGKYSPVAIIDDNNNIQKVFQSPADAGRILNLDRSNIRASIKRNGRCGGYKFISLTHDEYYEYFKNL